MIKKDGQQQESSTQINVVMNWFEELRAVMGGKNSSRDREG